METKQLLSIKTNLGSYNSFIENLTRLAIARKSSYVCVANVHMLIEAYRDSSFALVVNNADIVTPDGKPITWALRWLYDIKQHRVAGMDVLPDLLFAAEKLKVPVAFYGGTESMLNKTKDHLEKNYPDLIIAKLYSPPFRSLKEEENYSVIKMFNDSGAGIIFVVLGCPKQEKWMASMKDKIRGLMIGIGGALPVLVGMQKRAPAWMHNSGLEWFYRLSQEPKRLFKRYLTTNSLFIYLVIKEKLSFKKSKNDISA
jgi:N-acetylglucosaminyldiphosphoundecaprenol N-acetyl-beta-D-mannosaminyltransferase